MWIQDKTYLSGAMLWLEVKSSVGQATVAPLSGRGEKCNGARPPHTGEGRDVHPNF